MLQSRPRSFQASALGRWLLPALLTVARFCEAQILETEPNDSPAAPGVLPFGPGDSLQGHFFDCPAIPCPDYWSFVAIAGTAYLFQAGFAGSCVGFDPLDIALEIRNPADASLAVKDDFGGCGTEDLLWIAPAAGTYYLRAFSGSDNPSLGVTQYVIQVTTVILTPSPTPSLTPSLSPSATPSPSPSQTASASPTATAPSPTLSLSASPTPSPSPSSTAPTTTPTMTPTPNVALHWEIYE